MRGPRVSFGLAGLSAVAVALGSAWMASGREPEPRAPEAFFACRVPSHHDGDAIRCEGMKRSARLYGIDAPEMPGACRPGRLCTPGAPYAARDHLSSLTRSASVRCRTLDAEPDRGGFQAADHWGRPILQCFAGTVDLSCSMVSDGYAVQRYRPLQCDAEKI